MKANTTLYVQDPRRAMEFCRKVLSLEPTLDVPGKIEFQLSETHVLG